jgi:hypothetical protein
LIPAPFLTLSHDTVVRGASYTLIIAYSSVVTVAEWPLDGSFESQSRLEKPNSGSIPERPKICLTHFKPKTVKGYCSTVLHKYLYNNSPSNAIVNAASDITYRPVIGR